MLALDVPAGTFLMALYWVVRKPRVSSQDTVYLILRVDCHPVTANDTQLAEVAIPSRMPEPVPWNTNPI